MYNRPRSTKFTLVLTAGIVSILVPQYALAAKKVPVSWIAGVFNPERLKMCQEMEAAFEKKNPDIDIKFEPRGDLLQTILTRSAAGVALDVVWGWGEQFWPLVERNMLYDLTPNFKKDMDMDIFIPVTVEGAKYKGKIYSVDGRATSNFMVYNIDHYKRTGMATPNELSAKGNWTWDTYLEAAKKMTQDTNGDGKVDIWGACVRYGLDGMLQKILSAGGTMFSNDHTKCTLDNPKSIDAIAWQRDLVYRHKVSADKTKTQDWQGFQAGKTGIIEMGAWDFGLLRAKKGLRWDIALNPKGPAGLVNIFTPGGSYWIMRSSKHPKEAWRFVKWLYSEEGEKLVIKWGEVPMTKKAMLSDAYIKHPSGYPDHANVVYDSMKYAKPFYYPPSWARVSETLNAALDRIWLNKVSPQDGCIAAARDVTRLLATLKKK